MNRTCCERSAGPFSVVKSLLLLGCVLVAAFFVVGYAAGWIRVQRDPQKNTATIQIDTGEMQAEANQAAQKGEQLIEQAGDKIRDLGKSAERDRVPTSIRNPESTSETPSATPPASPPVAAPSPADPVTETI